MPRYAMRRLYALILSATLIATLLPAAPAALAQVANPFVSTGWQTQDPTNPVAAAWGDYDDDGDLDLAIGNNGPPIRIYRTDRGVLGVTKVWEASEGGAVSSVAWGDYDRDGYLDLAVGSSSAPTRIYKNNRGTLGTTPVWEAAEVVPAAQIAWGDYTGDGYLDLAVAVNGGASRVYRNNAGTFPTTAAWVAGLSAPAVGIGWADYDGDGRLDLAIVSTGAGEAASRLYRNEGNGVFAPAQVLPGVGTNVRALAWGDFDNNGRPDLAVGFGGAPTQILVNNAGVLGNPIILDDPDLDLNVGLAWGDYDGDGDLDLTAAHFGTTSNMRDNRIHRNDGGGSFAVVYPDNLGSRALGVAMGDYDNDGDLDLLFANQDGERPVLLYRNTSEPLDTYTNLVTLPSFSADLAWGDINGDGSLDLALANTEGVAPDQPAPSRIYINQGGVLSPGQILAATEKASSVAWGDVNADGQLDLAVADATGGPSRIYTNQGGALTPTWSAADGGAESLEWGDVDGDGDLDLAAAADRLRVYRNNGGQLEPAASWLAEPGLNPISIAWGDADRDGDLDLAVGRTGGVSLIRNEGGALGTIPVWSVNDATASGYGVAWGDYNGDGYLDLAVGLGAPFFISTVRRRLQLYQNVRGSLATSPVWQSDETTNLRQPAWGDYDGDGDLDLAVGGDGSLRVYRNRGGTIDTTAAWSAGGVPVNAVVWADYDGDGDLDLTAAYERASPSVNRNRLAGGRRFSGAPLVRVGIPAGTPLGGTGTLIYGAARLSIPFTLIGSVPAERILAQYSLDGGGSWSPATPAAGTATTNLPSSPTGIVHAFVWDVAADGVMGQADNVRMRILVPSGGAAGGPILYGSYAAVSPPFRLRGTQPRVVDAAGVPVERAAVYRLPVDLESSAPPLTNADNQQPWTTDLQGYLQGRSRIAIGDRLVALKEIDRRGKVRFFHTSAAPNAQDLTVAPVSATGVQTLTVSPANPLMLLDLDVSVEWDARSDTSFMERLRADLRRASRSLYDWSDGQAALGTVTIYQNKERWHDSFDAQGNLAVRGADIRIYASNRLRPSASQGGIVEANTPDLDRPELVYERGEVRIGAVWNRDGGFTPIDGSLDWAQALAHELGHYALYLDDNYLGLQNGRLVTVSGCRGAMADPYEASESEFHPEAGWLPVCADTLSNRGTGRSDWATIARYYNAVVPGFTLKAPAAYNANPGPEGLTIAVTQFVEPAPGQAGDAVRVLPVRNPGGTTYVPSSRVRAFAFGPGEASIVDLGRPTSDGRLLARGPRDRVCVFDLGRTEPRLGCAAGADSVLTMASRAGWQPDIRLTGVTSRTVTVSVPASSVGQPAPAKLVARLFPADSPLAPITVDLNLSGDAYSGTLAPSEPVIEGYLLVSVPDDSAPARAAVTDYAIGGSPAPKRRSKTRNKRRAPLVSPDGGAVLFTEGVTFGLNQFFSLQTATRLPADPPIAVPIAQGYRLIGDDAAIKLLQDSRASINLSYASADLGILDPATATVYYYPDDGSGWQRLETARDPASNEVSATLVGRGLYVVMASELWDLTRRGLRRNVPYPGATAPLPEALTPLAGRFAYIYGRDEGDAADPWKVYAPAAPAWVNDLRQLETDERYHIMVLSPLLAPVKPPDAAPSGAGELAQALPEPPALIYGVLTPSRGFNPQPGQAVTASFGEQVCAETTTRLVEGKLVFSFDVPSEDEVPGCGRLGRSFTLTIGEYVWPRQVGWSNETIYDLAGRRLYLPLLRKR